MWEIWKKMLMETIDKHAPLRTRRIKKRKSPWITNDLRHRIFNRDYLKKNATRSNDSEIWSQYKHARNQINNEIKKTKRAYFTNHLDLNKGNMKKTWNLINELSSRDVRKTKRITELITGEREITSPIEITETFNNYFSNVGDNLAAEIASPGLSMIQVFYLNRLPNLFHYKLLPLIQFSDC